MGVSKFFLHRVGILPTRVFGGEISRGAGRKKTPRPKRVLLAKGIHSGAGGKAERSLFASMWCSHKRHTF